MQQTPKAIEFHLAFVLGVKIVKNFAESIEELEPILKDLYS
jgi:hypothetical protein